MSLSDLPCADKTSQIWSVYCKLLDPFITPSRQKRWPEEFCPRIALLTYTIPVDTQWRSLVALDRLRQGEKPNLEGRSPAFFPDNSPDCSYGPPVSVHRHARMLVCNVLKLQTYLSQGKISREIFHFHSDWWLCDLWPAAPWQYQMEAL